MPTPAQPLDLFPPLHELEPVIWPGFALLLFVVSGVATDIIILLATRLRLVDLPNRRSAHALPTARGGGLAITLTATVAAIAVALRWPGMASAVLVGTLLPCLAIATCGMIDDIRPLNALLRLGLQVGAALAITTILGPLEELGLPGLFTLPLGPLALFANRLLVSLARRHPRLFVRLGEAAAKTFVIDPTDLPFVFVLRPDPLAPSIVAVWREQDAVADARIAGPLAALLGLIHGVYDGDAMFCARDLAVEGDMEAALALRNAIDDAELDLAADFIAILGPLGWPAEAFMRAALPTIGWFAQVFSPLLPEAPRR